MGGADSHERERKSKSQRQNGREARFIYSEDGARARPAGVSVDALPRDRLLLTWQNPETPKAVEVAGSRAAGWVWSSSRAGAMCLALEGRSEASAVAGWLGRGRWRYVGLVPFAHSAAGPAVIRDLGLRVCVFA